VTADFLAARLVAVPFFGRSALRAALSSSLACGLVPMVAIGQGSPAEKSPQVALPPAWQVIDRYLDAAGGRPALLKLASREVWARYEIPARSLSGELRVLSARPNRLLIKTEYPELGVAVTGFDGSVGWTADPGSKPRLAKGGALADLHTDAVFDRYDEENLISAQTIDVSEFDGRPCVKLKIVRVPGRESYEYFDARTGLFAGSVMLRDTEKGPVTMRTIVSRYETTDGVKLPRQIRITVGGVQQIVTVMRVRHNQVDPAVFAPPASLARAAP
jgi:hypothetical protein